MAEEAVKERLHTARWATDEDGWAEAHISNVTYGGETDYAGRPKTVTLELELPTGEIEEVDYAIPWPWDEDNEFARLAEQYATGDDVVLEGRTIKVRGDASNVDIKIPEPSTRTRVIESILTTVSEHWKIAVSVGVAITVGFAFAAFLPESVIIAGDEGLEVTSETPNYIIMLAGITFLFTLFVRELKRSD